MMYLSEHLIQGKLNMITKQKHKILTLPYIPLGSQFMLDSTYAKEVDGILHLWDCFFKQPENGKWVSKNKTLTEYNNYLVKETHEYTTLQQVLYDAFSNNWRGAFTNAFSGRKFYIFKNWDEEYYVSFYTPKAKGFKGDKKRIRYGAGECLKLDKSKYPQLDKLVGENILIDRPYKGN